jgi:hypothetical protein
LSEIHGRYSNLMVEFRLVTVRQKYQFTVTKDEFLAHIRSLALRKQDAFANVTLIGPTC